jgi:hypothetical protein
VRLCRARAEICCRICLYKIKAPTRPLVEPPGGPPPRPGGSPDAHANMAAMNALATGMLVACVAGVFGLGGAVLNANRESVRWRRQSRFEAYADFLAAVTKLALSQSQLQRIRGELPATGHPFGDITDWLDAIDTLELTAARASLLGPEALDEPRESLTRAALQIGLGHGADIEQLNSAQRTFIHAARQHL